MRHRALLAEVAAGALVLAACGDDDDDGAAPADTGATSAPDATDAPDGSSAAGDTCATGKTITPAPIPNRYDQTALLFDWVERGTAPPMSVVVTAGERSLPLCSYPSYPRYTSGPTEAAASYRCAQ